MLTSFPMYYIITGNTSIPSVYSLQSVRLPEEIILHIRLSQQILLVGGSGLRQTANRIEFTSENFPNVRMLTGKPLLPGINNFILTELKQQCRHI